MRIFRVPRQLIVQRDAVFVRQQKRRAARMFARDWTHRQNTHRSPVARAIQNSADLDSTARQPLESFGDFMTDLFDHNEGILDRNRTFGDGPRSEFRFAHAWTSAIMLIVAPSSPGPVSSFSCT